MKWTTGAGRSLPVVVTNVSRCYATDGKVCVFIYTWQSLTFCDHNHLLIKITIDPFWSCFLGEVDIVVIGSGPGGYVASIKAAQLGMKVMSKTVTGCEGKGIH